MQFQCGYGKHGTDLRTGKDQSLFQYQKREELRLFRVANNYTYLTCYEDDAQDFAAWTLTIYGTKSTGDTI